MLKRLENEILSFFNSAKTPQQIVDRFRLGDKNIITFKQAKNIIKIRNNIQRKNITSLRQLERIAGITKETFERWGNTFHSNLLKNCPVLLFPIRLETRFDIDKRELLIRIYPDKISLDTHEPELTRDEFEIRKMYKDVFKGNSDEDKRNCWHKITRLYGNERAAYIVKTMFEPDTNEESDLKESSWTRGPRVRNLPDKYLVYLYRGDTLTRNPVPGNSVNRDLTLFGLPTDSSPRMFDLKSEWAINFNKAEECGMGIRIPNLSDEDMEQGFSRIIVIGLHSTTSDS